MELTTQERTVLQARAHGLLTEEIAGEYAIPVSTVHETLVAAMAKLDARSPLEAVVRGLRGGQLTMAASRPSRNGDRGTSNGTR